MGQRWWSGSIMAASYSAIRCRFQCHAALGDFASTPLGQAAVAHAEQGTIDTLTSQH